MKRLVKPQTLQQEVDKFWMRRFNLSAYLFDKQLDFVEDPAPYKVAVCSRRAGKTIACAAHLIHTAINSPGVNCLYITLSRANAKRIVWKDLRNINEKHKLGGEINESELSITFQNNSTVYLSGCHDATEIENFRGLALSLCYIDECQSFRSYLEDLIDDIIGPSLIDHAGTLALIGTPGPLPSGFFHNCAVKSEVWSKHGWTFFDNPHIAIKSGKTHQEILDRELKRRGVPVTHKSIRREWFGAWEHDSDSLLLHYDPNINDFNNLPVIPPNKKYNYILGVDIGFKDADALAVLAYSDYDHTTYLIDELVTTKQGITELVEQIQMLRSKYDIHKIIMDMGALGKKIGEEIIRRHQIPVEAADKTRKMENIELLNDAMRTGKFKAKANSRFAQDSYIIEIDKDKSTPDRIAVSNRFHSDIADAVLYGFKLSPAYTYTTPIKAPERGTAEWAKQQSNAMFEAELAGHQQEIADSNQLYGILSD